MLLILIKEEKSILGFSYPSCQNIEDTQEDTYPLERFRFDRYI